MLITSYCHIDKSRSIKIIMVHQLPLYTKQFPRCAYRENLKSGAYTTIEPCQNRLVLARIVFQDAVSTLNTRQAFEYSNWLWMDTQHQQNQMQCWFSTFIQWYSKKVRLHFYHALIFVGLHSSIQLPILTLSALFRRLLRGQHRLACRLLLCPHSDQWTHTHTISKRQKTFVILKYS